jgi:hypothetical protein
MEINLAVPPISELELEKKFGSGEKHLKVEPVPEGLPNRDGLGYATGAADFSAGMIKIFSSICIR